MERNGGHLPLSTPPCSSCVRMQMTGLACVHGPVTHVRTWLSSSFACSPSTHSLKLGSNNETMMGGRLGRAGQWKRKEMGMNERVWRNQHWVLRLPTWLAATLLDVVAVQVTEASGQPFTTLWHCLLKDGVLCFPSHLSNCIWNNPSGTM